jgi:hypothetical protein
MMTETITITYNAGVRDDLAGTSTDYQTLLSTTALVVPLSGEASLLAASMGYHDGVEFHVDYDSFHTVYTASAQGRMLRIGWDGKVYRVTGIVDAGNRHLVSILQGALLP